MYLRPIAKGLLTHVPGLLKLAHRRTAGSDSARYCYSVWLRHLCKAAEAGLAIAPRVVAELGPGDSLGMGIAALLCGAERLLALDIERFAPAPRNLQMLDELVELFQRRAPIPDAAELPLVQPKLDDYAFPAQLLDPERLERALAPARVAAIRSALRGEEASGPVRIEYRVPWHREIEASSVDLVYSQACLEHVDALEEAYEAMARWLVPGGAISHQIDFKSHEITPEWDGHRQYSDFTWSLLRGARSFLLNREPLSTHLRLIERWFEIRTLVPIRREPELPESRLAARFRTLSPDDRSTCGLFVQAVRR